MGQEEWKRGSGRGWERTEKKEERGRHRKRREGGREEEDKKWKGIK